MALLVVLTGSVSASTPDNSEISMHLLDKLSIHQVNSFITKINGELNENIPLLTGDNIQNIASKGLDLSWRHVWQGLVDRLFKELTINIHLMGKLLFLAVLCALLQNLQNSFEHSAISLLAYGICFIFLAVIALTAFYNTLAMARQTVDNMVGFMEALLPLLISLLAGVGALTSVAIFTPFMLMTVSIVSLIVKDIVMPLLVLTAVLECVSYLSDKYPLSNLVGVFKQTSMIILGLTLVIFIGIISIQGAVGSVADGIALRTAKYATATFIPVVGKMFADTVELVMGASLLLKNAIGILGVIAIMTICAVPILKLLSLIIIMKVTGALIQPMGDKRMAKCLDGMGNNLLLVFGAVLTVALMFFISITMIIGVGSVAMMLR